MKKTTIFFITANLALIFSVNYFFINIKKMNAQNVLSTVQTVMSNQENLINPLRASQGLLDLSRLGVIDCLLLQREKDSFIFLRQANDELFCKINKELDNQVKKFETSNGVSWKISFFLKDPPYYGLFKNITLLLLFLINASLFLGFHFREKFHKSNVKNEQEKLKEKLKLAQQVSHDIRSPLAALQMAIEEIQDIPDEYRKMINTSVQRINDIANNLLSKHKLKNHEIISNELEILLTAEIVDSLISEKRMQYRKNPNVEIITDFSKSYGLFVRVQPIEFGRLLSNLINNSVDAMNGPLKIKVSIAEINERIVISISDNGKGIPSYILEKLGEDGVTYGKENNKESGNGLGISHAKKMIEAINGEFIVTSQVNLGTEIKILLPKAAPAPWFQEELVFESATTILILDDDENIHSLWKEKFVKLNNPIISFKSAEALILYFNETKNTHNHYCLIDHDLEENQLNGLNVIQHLNLELKSTLVTSRFDQADIINSCQVLKLKIIPKKFLSLIPIISKCAEEFYEYVYIDDDELMRLTWTFKAAKKNIKLLCLANVKEFASHLNKISKDNTMIYIDNELGLDELKGEDFAIQLYNEKYKHLYIASGYDANHFAHLPWLKWNGKNAPF